MCVYACVCVCVLYVPFSFCKNNVAKFHQTRRTETERERERERESSSKRSLSEATVVQGMSANTPTKYPTPGLIIQIV